MFPTAGLFQKLPCPEKQSCKRTNCLFNHKADIKEVPTVHIPVETPKPTPSSSRTVAQPPIASTSKATPPSIPAKRPISSPLRTADAANGLSSEPPKKLQRVGTAQKATAKPTLSVAADGAPLLRVIAAQSQVPVPVRQTMLKSLWEHFKVLYHQIAERNPTLAAEHALRQEEEVYNKSTKVSYRNAVISSIAALKRRPMPDNINHASVGTDGDIAKREEELKKLEALKLTVSDLEPYVMTLDELRVWGYIVEIPPGPGGDRPSEEGAVQKCERCQVQFKVKRKDEADQCRYHWGKPFTSKTNGERHRVYQCCSRTTDEEPCSTGPHVFYEHEPELLHSRHPFSNTRPAFGDRSTQSSDTALDIVALDCEMIYTTGGMRVARVSAVDSNGKEVFDELVRMDDGVEVIDFNTRFSGITEEAYSKAVLQLADIRKALDALINSDTILIGHALDNDLKTLRMIHHRCVDTVAIFPHQAGPPYRRALRNLAKEHLGRVIQTGGATAGHSSIEDSIATLDLVRWHVLNRPRPKLKTVQNTG